MNFIHPTAVIDSTVELGHGNYIGPHVYLTGNLIIGNNNHIGASCVIGTAPESVEYYHSGRDAIPYAYGPVSIGDNNVIRELSVIQSPTTGITGIGNNCFFMHAVHLGHDDVIGNNVTMAPFTCLAGHVIVEDWVNLGMHSVVKQYVKIYESTMVGMGAVVTKNHLPFSVLTGVPAKPTGSNEVGISRRGLESGSETIHLAMERYENEKRSQK